MAKMHVDPEVRRIKEGAEEDLLKIPGVNAVDVGFKEVNGQPTEVIAIRVHVKKKKPTKDVPARQRIPKEINGVPTDVIERTYVLHQLGARVKESDLKLQADAGTYDPLKGGISIGPCRAVGGYVYVGTLGAVVKDNGTGDTLLLSNFHVMCIDNGWAVGDTMAQPGRVDGGTCPANVTGTLLRASLGGQVDGAVSTVSGHGTLCEIVDIGGITGTNTATLGQAVRKRGRTTLLTYGTVESVDLTVNVDYGDGLGVQTLTHQIGVAPDTAQNPMFSDHGDSGSVVVNNSVEVVGLLFAGSDDGHSVANPIASVLTALNISMCTAAPKKRWAKDFIKDKIEHKEWKLEKFEIKESIKEFREKSLLSEFPPKSPKELVEGGFPGFPGGPVEHFIRAEQRPDLSMGALKREEDLAELLQTLEEQAKTAKDTKDTKDLEKLSEQ
jgi:hypothetical protein